MGVDDVAACLTACLLSASLVSVPQFFQPHSDTAAAAATVVCCDASVGAAGLLSRPPGSCWSSFIPGPHFKVCATGV